MKRVSAFALLSQIFYLNLHDKLSGERWSLWNPIILWVFLSISLPSANERSEEILGLGGECSENWRNNFSLSKFAHWIFNFFFIQTFSSLSVCWKFSSSLAHLKNNIRQEYCAFGNCSRSGECWVLVREYWSRSVLGISLITPLRASRVAWKLFANRFRPAMPWSSNFYL